MDSLVGVENVALAEHLISILKVIQGNLNFYIVVEELIGELILTDKNKKTKSINVYVMDIGFLTEKAVNGVCTQKLN